MGSVILVGVLADQQFKLYRERRRVAEIARQSSTTTKVSAAE
jgi:hypothetical protein